MGGACCSTVGKEEGELYYFQQEAVMLDYVNKGGTTEDLESEFEQMIKEIELQSHDILVFHHILYDLTMDSLN